MKLDRVIIKTANYQDSFSFYHDTLGLKLKTSWQRKDSWGALFFCGEAFLEIIWIPNAGDSRTDLSLPVSSITELYLKVNNVDALYNNLGRNENLKLSKPENKPWGDRVFWVFDPDRVKIVFSQPI